MSAGSCKSERELIRRLRAEVVGGSASPAGGPTPLLDDMAPLPAEGWLWTVDALMDGVDFDGRRHPWEQVGRKAMAVNLSDCAAMGARPAAALCSVVLDNRLSLEDALALHRGAHDCGLRFGCPIVGGDTNSWDDPTVISITVVARMEGGQAPVRRDGARPGDVVCLSGPVGGSILGRHLAFTPRVELGLEVRRRLDPHAMIDISDGLALDLGRILEASGCGSVLHASALEGMIHPDARRLAAQDGRPALEHALHDGEDFELIVVLPAATPAGDYEALGLRAVGRIEAGSGLVLEEPDGTRRPVEPRGWEHFHE